MDQVVSYLQIFPKSTAYPTTARRNSIFVAHLSRTIELLLRSAATLPSFVGVNPPKAAIGSFGSMLCEFETVSVSGLSATGNGMYSAAVGAGREEVVGRIRRRAHL